MSAGISAVLDPQMLDDFFGEADEHLASIRQGLLRLEEFVGKAQIQPDVIAGLFQDFHSFKGISALVGLGPAEALAHATEDFLRLLRDRKAELTAGGVEVLTAATKKLEHLVAAFRSGDPLPACDSLLAELKSYCNLSSLPDMPATQSNSSYPELSSHIEEAKARGALLWNYTFTPSKELDASGMNVNCIREELSGIGDILKATPLIEGKGKVAFEFLVAARQTPSDLSAWERKGVIVKPVEQDHEPGDLAQTPSESSAQDGHSLFVAPSHVVRVDLKRLDDLMRITGEMVIYRSRLEAQLSRLNGHQNGMDLRPVQEVSASLGRSLREMREAIMRVRLVPVAEIFARMPFVVKDLASRMQKRVRVQLAGQETAIDKYLVERLKDPLLHLVRNACSHGIETIGEREAASKPQEGTITLSASTAGDSVVIQVRDDGRGINRHTIMRRAKSLGLEVPEATENHGLLSILCASGFSTRDGADRASGRGVGMTVVNTIVRELGGNLSLESKEGHGTQFTVSVPLTLAIAETLVVKAVDQTCAIPQSIVREIQQVTEVQIQRANGVEVIAYREGVLPVIRLSTFFGISGAHKLKMCLLVIATAQGSVGLLADEVVGQKEVVVSALRDPLIQVPGVSGATELGDGRPVLILDGAAFTSGSVRPLEQAPAAKS